MFSFLFFFPPPPPRSTLFPYTTLFRSFAAPLHRHTVAFINLPCGGRFCAVVPGSNREEPSPPVQAPPPRASADLPARTSWIVYRSEEHTSELQSRENLVCRLLLEKKNI